MHQKTQQWPKNVLQQCTYRAIIQTFSNETFAIIRLPLISVPRAPWSICISILWIWVEFCWVFLKGKQSKFILKSDYHKSLSVCTHRGIPFSRRICTLESLGVRIRIKEQCEIRIFWFDIYFCYFSRCFGTTRKFKSKFQ